MREVLSSPRGHAPLRETAQRRSAPGCGSKRSRHGSGCRGERVCAAAWRVGVVTPAQWRCWYPMLLLLPPTAAESPIHASRAPGESASRFLCEARKLGLTHRRCSRVPPPGRGKRREVHASIPFLPTATCASAQGQPRAAAGHGCSSRAQGRDGAKSKRRLIRYNCERLRAARTSAGEAVLGWTCTLSACHSDGTCTTIDGATCEPRRGWMSLA